MQAAAAAAAAPAAAAAAPAALAPAPTPAAVAASLAAAKLEKPEDAVYTVPVPEGLTLLELDTIKVTAQVGFLRGLRLMKQLARHTENICFAAVYYTGV